MRLMLGALVRLIVATAIVLTVVAVSLGRSSRPRGAEERRMADPRFQPLNDFLFQDMDPALRVLDLESGFVTSFRLADGGRLVHPACSPWQDSQGRRQVIGAWKSAPGAGSRVVGLARYAIPTGEFLEQVEVLEPVPSSSPCWFPDRSLRVVFAGYDGRLYRLSFESPGGGLGDEHRTTPQRVDWPSNLRPGSGSPKFFESVWPVDPRLGGRLIATLMFDERDLGSRRQPRLQLWWLRLTPDGLAIVDGGRLVRSSLAFDEGESVSEERLAGVSASVDGRLVVAYMVRRGDRVELDLQLAPLAIDSSTGAPWVDAADAVTIARDCAFTPPAFSVDGRWIYSMTRWPPNPARIDRSSIVEILDKCTDPLELATCPADSE